VKPGRLSGKRRTRERIARDRARLQQMRPDDWDGAADPRAVEAERTTKKQENQ
jgi:hypothetical protein